MWPLWRRLRFFGAAGVICAAIATGLELLIADIPGERAFNRFTPSGEIPLWPTVRGTALWIVTSSLAIGVLLPLYRRRHGWVMVSGGLCLMWLALAVGFGAEFRLPADAVGRLQTVTAIAGLVLLVGVSAREGRAAALGRPDSAASESPPVA